jgi:hypothetical protein
MHSPAGNVALSLLRALRDHATTSRQYVFYERVIEKQVFPIAGPVQLFRPAIRWLLLGQGFLREVFALFLKP